MAKRTGPQVLTANDLPTGAVVRWADGRWSAHYAKATRADDEGTRAALASVAIAREADDRVVRAALVTLDADGLPTGLRGGRRLAGPSIALPVHAPLAEAA